MDWPELLPLAAWLTVHVGGIAVAVMSRLSIGKRTDIAFQTLTCAGFFAIAALAVQTILAGGDHFRLAVISAAALGAMVVATVIESRPTHFDPTLDQFLRADK
ncbi:MAG: hypothetical protein AAF589_07110 [Planctomycetota bacterium]